MFKEYIYILSAFDIQPEKLCGAGHGFSKENQSINSWYILDIDFHTAIIMWYECIGKKNLPTIIS